MGLGHPSVGRDVAPHCCLLPVVAPHARLLDQRYTIVALPSMSSATIIGAAIFGQLIASMVIDHFGWFNVPVVPINTSRIIGAVLLLIGAILMRRT
jgi:hypothetical protein